MMIKTRAAKAALLLPDIWLRCSITEAFAPLGVQLHLEEPIPEN